MRLLIILFLVSCGTMEDIEYIANNGDAAIDYSVEKTEEYIEKEKENIEEIKQYIERCFDSLTEAECEVLKEQLCETTQYGEC